MSTAEDLEFLENLKSEFYDEAYEFLNDCESVILQYEKQPESELTKEYMRILHSMKGSAKAVDLDRIAHALHLMESKCTESDSPTFVNETLKAIDCLRESLDSFRNHDYDSGGQSIESLIKSLED